MIGQQRLDAVRAALQAAQFDALALTPGASFRYVTGLNFHASERLTLLVVPAEETPALVLPNFEVSAWRAHEPFDAALFPWDDTVGPAVAVREMAATIAVRPDRIAVEPLVMRLMEADHLRAAYSDAALEPADAIMQELRLRKSAEEIASVRQAAAIAERALEEWVRLLKKGETERQLAGRLSSLLLEGGGEGISFGPIVLAGANSALPHGVPGDYAPRPGDLLLVDFGTSFGGYHCDITRTFVYGAEPDAETRRVYEAVRAGNAAGCAAVRPGVTAGAVHAAAQGDFARAEFEGFITHRTGHGLGLEVHEPPSIMAGNEFVLEPGMVFTVEPGLYREGWGGVRIEDDVLVTADGVDSLTRFSRELTVVGP